LHQLSEIIDRMTIDGGVDGLLEAGFYPLQVPAAEIVPYERVQYFQRFAQPEFRKQLFNLSPDLPKTVPEPFDGKARVGGQGAVVFLTPFPTLNQLERIPHLVIEIAALFER